MTKEELEKEAGEYADEHAFRVPYDGSNKFYDDVDFKASKEGFLAGLKAGRPQWHKITDWKKQEQFPDNTFKKYLVYVNLKYLKIKQYIICILDITEGYRQFYLDDGDDSIDPEDVIAWCEIPTFDKE